MFDWFPFHDQVKLHNDNIVINKTNHWKYQDQDEN